MTVCGCGEFDYYHRTPTIYELMAKKTNGRLVRFEEIQSSLASYLGTAALEEDFVQNVLDRVGRMNLSDDAYDKAVEEAMEGMESMFRSLSREEFSVKTWFDVAKFDDVESSEQVKATFRSLSATTAIPDDDRGGGGAGAGYRSLSADDGGEGPVFRSLGSDDGEDPPAKVMRSAPRAPAPPAAHVTTTRQRLRRRP